MVHPVVNAIAEAMRNAETRTEIRAILSGCLVEMRRIDRTGNDAADAKILEAEQAIRAALKHL